VPRRGVVVTFDDGYVDALDAAHPLLHAHDVPATLFVSTGNVGRAGEFWWDELEHLLLRPVALPPALQLTSATAARRWELGPAAEYDARTHEHTRHLHVFDAPAGTRQAFYYAVWQWLFPIAHEERQRLLGEIARWAGVERAPRASFRTLRPDEIRAVADGGLVEIGAHTVTHPPLALHSVEAQRREVVGSRDALREILGRPVTSFSYPHGEHSTDTVGLVRDAGFVRACTVESGRVHARSDPLRLPRFTVQDWTGEELERRLSSWLGG
jgi:peptidoglycan/xylan/chitin deacetylase (PgdA/CDA1 family)